MAVATISGQPKLGNSIHVTVSLRLTHLYLRHAAEQPDPPDHRHHQWQKQRRPAFPSRRIPPANSHGCRPLPFSAVGPHCAKRHAVGKIGPATATMPSPRDSVHRLHLLRSLLPITQICSSTNAVSRRHCPFQRMMGLRNPSTDIVKWCFGVFWRSQESPGVYNRLY
ncbi:hypothetical protein FXO37_19871 [Capsicum annuum]|nr:hypothetical protein FXO37_19871 [Capsicum annuum]